jgi:hypothetical protein
LQAGHGAGRHHVELGGVGQHDAACGAFDHGALDRRLLRIVRRQPGTRMQRAGTEEGDVRAVRAHRGQRSLADEDARRRQPVAAGEHQADLRLVGDGQRHVQRVRDDRQRAWRIGSLELLHERQRGRAAVDEQAVVGLHVACTGQRDGALGAGEHAGTLCGGQHGGVQGHGAAVGLLHEAAGGELAQVAPHRVFRDRVLGGELRHLHTAKLAQRLGDALLALGGEAWRLGGAGSGGHVEFAGLCTNVQITAQCSTCKQATCPIPLPRRPPATRCVRGTGRSARSSSCSAAPWAPGVRRCPR